MFLILLLRYLNTNSCLETLRSSQPQETKLSFSSPKKDTLNVCFGNEVSHRTQAQFHPSLFRNGCPEEGSMMEHNNNEYGRLGWSWSRFQSYVWNLPFACMGYLLGDSSLITYRKQRPNESCQREEGFANYAISYYLSLDIFNYFMEFTLLRSGTI